MSEKKPKTFLEDAYIIISTLTIYRFTLQKKIFYRERIFLYIQIIISTFVLRFIWHSLTCVFYLMLRDVNSKNNILCEYYRQT